MPRQISDPIERLVTDALNVMHIPYTHETENKEQGLDFKLANGVLIEVKQFPTERITAQIEGRNNVILIVGREAAETFANLIAHGRMPL